MKKIEGSPKSLKQLLQNTKYSIHYYQREYMWQRKHIEELIDDLTSEFLDYYVPGDNRQKVQDYGAYFMGSIVLAGRENAIIDGQQRFEAAHPCRYARRKDHRPNLRSCCPAAFHRCGVHQRLPASRCS